MLRGKTFYFKEPVTAYMTRDYSNVLPKGKEVGITSIKIVFGCVSGLGITLDDIKDYDGKNLVLDSSWVTTKPPKEKPYFMGGKLVQSKELKKR